MLELLNAHHGRRGGIKGEPGPHPGILSHCQELLCTDPHRAGVYLENSYKEAVHSRDPATYRPTLDQLHGRTVGRNSQGEVLRDEHSKMNTRGSTWEGRTLGRALRGKHLSRRNI